MSAAEIIVKAPREEDGHIVLGADLRITGLSPFVLWYRVPVTCRDWLTESADPFVIALVFPMMAHCRQVRVQGRVSPSLLRNLEAFMSVWHAWAPAEYSPVHIVADTEAEPETTLADRPAIMSFSGGLDSAFTAFRHARGLVGRRTLAIRAGVFVRGFDIPLKREDAFRAACAANEKMLGSLGMQHIPVATNYREMNIDWLDSHGAALAAVLALFQRQFSVGVFSASLPFAAAVVRWGTHPLTDPLLGSVAFPVYSDGAECRRVDKAEVVADWPEAMEHLRVCWEGPLDTPNCGRCEKCIRTILEFRIAGREPPLSLRREIPDHELRCLSLRSRAGLGAFRASARMARDRGHDASWVDAMDVAVERGERLEWMTRLRPHGRRLRRRVRQWLDSLSHRSA